MSCSSCKDKDVEIDANERCINNMRAVAMAKDMEIENLKRQAIVLREESLRNGKAFLNLNPRVKKLEEKMDYRILNEKKCLKIFSAIRKALTPAQVMAVESNLPDELVKKNNGS